MCFGSVEIKDRDCNLARLIASCVCVFVQIPMLVPGLDYVFETFIQCLSDRGISDLVKVRYLGVWSVIIVRH